MSKRFFFSLFTLILSYSVSAQNVVNTANLPQNYFINPVNIPLSLSGNFGELRGNHFHSGLDIRTQQRTGIKVHATANGYVSRIKKGLYGYGNVIYIQHPNGYTTVYGHLLEFAPKIRKYVRKRQYALEKNVIELFPKKGELPVQQGEVIALSGQSGGAGGPHLHYEIRDGAQRPMNPLLFGVKISDSYAPALKSLFVYPQNNGYVNGDEERQQLHLIPDGKNSYRTQEIKAHGAIGFGIEAVDHMDNPQFTDGIYQLQTRLNGVPQLKITFNRFSFANTRYINRYIDYTYLKEHKSTVQKLFLQPNNKIDMQIDQTQKGFVNIISGQNYNFEILLKDYVGNETVVHIPIVGKELPESQIKKKTVQKTAYLAKWNTPNVFDLKYHDIYIPKGALYENTYLDLSDDVNQVKVHHSSTPLQKNITIGFNASQYTPEDRRKLYVARVSPWGSKSYSTTYKKGTRITTKTRTFGTYELATDDNAPSIIPINFKNGQWISSVKFLRLKIDDNESGISTYRATLNHKFIVLEYDYKTGIIKYDFRDGKSVPGKNHLKVIVVDNVGNSKQYEADFFRKS